VAKLLVTRDAFTFDDVLLEPQYTEVLPTEVQLATLFSRNISLNIPLCSAAMDTVTEGDLAIAIARQGGIGVVHKNLSIEQQAGEVDRVKRSESGMITDPHTVKPYQTIGDALALMENFRVSGVPVIDDDGILVGILTNRDLRFFDDPRDTLVRELMTSQGLITAPVGTTLEQARRMFREKKIEKLPLVDEQGHLRGLMTVKDLQNRQEFPNAAKDAQGRLRVAAAVGVVGDFEERAVQLVQAGVDALVVETAHAHSMRVLTAIRTLKHRFSETDLVAGNVSTAKATKALIEAGADGVKTGQGPGSTCTTRIVTGCGMPQITAINECVMAAAESGVPVIADGGIKYSGDLTKAIAAGAHCVMIGNLFAGTTETPGEMELYQGSYYKVYRGMGSIAAMTRGSADRYGQERSRGKLVAEGIEGKVPHRGSLVLTIEQLVGGLCSGMGLMGCLTIELLREQSDRFVRITAAGGKESHVHGVVITTEAPNYKPPQN
jgi:IMP dehydrogenase